MNQEKSPLPTSKEILEFKYVEQAINAAVQFCQNLKFDYSHWHGAPPPPERLQQAKESAAKLQDFDQVMKDVDNRRWEEFRRSFYKGELSTNHPNFKDHIEMIVTYKIKGPNWVRLGAVEVEYFIKFLENTKHASGESWSNDVKTFFDASRIGVIVGEFLTLHVGTEGHKVSGEPTGENRTGFDGEAISCPISVMPTRGIMYFSYVCAEYVLMNAILEKFTPPVDDIIDES